MSGSHLSKELFDLIKSIGEARSKQEEDKIILNEARALVDRLKEKKIPDKKMKEYLVRGIYIELLGHNASFAHITAINMSQSKSLQLKRLAYLACTLFLTEKSQSQILLVATLQKDLQSKVDMEVVSALTTLCKIVNSSILEAVMEPVYKLLNHKSSLVKKKAVMVVHKFYQINPALLDDIDSKMKKALCDKDPCVMAASLNYFYTVVKANPNRYKELVSSFVVILKQVIEHRLPKEYDFHRMPAPWVQMKLLAILGLLGQYDQATSESMYEVLNLTIRRADDLGINIGYAIVYQCLKTIITIYPYKSLVEQSANAISRFLNTDNRNLKYVGITGLALIVGVNPEYALQHQSAIVECLEDSDDTLKGKTIDLLYKMTNYKNVSSIVDKFLSFLKTSSADSALRKDLVYKINQLAERFATNKAWFISTTNQLFEISGDLITPDITNSFIRLIQEWEEDQEAVAFRQYAIDLYIGLLRTSTVISDALMEVMTFVIGLYGPQVLTDEKNIATTIGLFSKWLEYPFSSERIKALILTAVQQLHRALRFTRLEIVDQLLNKLLKSRVPELRQRAAEHFRFLAKPSITGDLLQQSVDEPDPALNFLSAFVESRGGPKYDETKSLTGLQSIQPKLQTQPYRAPEKRSYRREDNPLFPKEVHVDTHLVVNVPHKITKDGYIGSVPTTSQAQPAKAAKPVDKSGFSASDFPSAPSPKDKPERPAKKPAKRPEPALVITGKTEKDIFRETLFSGIGDTVAPVDTPPEARTTAGPVAESVSAGAGVSASPGRQVNLLDLDMGGEEKKDETKTGGIAALADVFSSGHIEAKVSQEFMFAPYKMVMEDFGAKWLAFPTEQMTRVSLRPGLQKEQLAAALERLGFCLVSLRDNEAILSSTLNEAFVCLLHFIWAEASVTFTLKMADKTAPIANILSYIVSAVQA